MRKSITRVSVAVAAAAALSALGATGMGAPGATAWAQAAPAPTWGASHVAAVPGAQLWLKRYSGPGNRDDTAGSVAVSPGGGTVFVTGASDGGVSGNDYLTVAYNAATGAQRWVKRYNGPANSYDEAQSIAVSPDGTKVFVTGSSAGASSVEDYATIAYNAATGAQLWIKRYNGPTSSYDEARSIAVSPGGKVFVTGSSYDANTADWDCATVAYNAATGGQLWVKRYHGPANLFDGGFSVAVSPEGSAVFVAGFTMGATSSEDYLLLAYYAPTGAQLWVKRYNGPANGADYAQSVAVSPDGASVFVTGQSPGVAGGYQSLDYTTIAYNAATGAQRWVKRYNGPANATDYAQSVAVSPTKDTLFVTGASTGTISGLDYTTIAYYAPTGAQLWVKRYDPGNLLPATNDDYGNAVAVSPSGGTVFVTGTSDGATSQDDYATVAYDAATGAQRWVKRYNGPANSNDWAGSLAVSPNGDRVFVTGGSTGPSSGYDYTTIAYSP